MNNDRFRVVLANEPFTFRSALQMALAADGCFEAYLVPEGSTYEAGEKAEVFFVSTPVDQPESLVVCFHDNGNAVEIRDHGSSELFAYENLESVFEMIRTRLIGRPPPDRVCASPPGFRDPPGERGVRSP